MSGSRGASADGDGDRTIRRAVAADADALTDLARAAKASWNYPAAWLRAWEDDLRVSEAYVRDHPVFVVESHGRAVGVVAVEDGPEGPEVAHLWVAPEEQGRGVGRLLMARACQAARDAGWTSLRIVSDPNARPFYERLGAVYVSDVAAPVLGRERTLPVLRLDLRR